MRYLLAVSMVLVPTLVYADVFNFVTGNKALENCRKDANWCFGYSMAIVDTATGIRPNDICIPENVTGGQVKGLFLKTLNESPESLHQPAPYAFLAKLMVLFPCRD